ncbi:MAG TPA: methionine--tRNA ligase [Longimicrobiales bacterium]|nr:methionine--tRNA ligase [Longimicrobiales bacterium]
MTDALYVTTTIPYVNAAPHVGFALELVQADAIARYHRLVGEKVRLQSGTDENAFKNVLSARARGVSTGELVSENAARFRALCSALDLSIDAFVRTTEPAHRRAVDAFLGRLRVSDLFCASYEGYYCTGCEDFYRERDLVQGRCPEHDTEAVVVAEQNHFFRLSAYQTALDDLIAAGQLRIVPAARETEVLQFIRRGLSDISISRSRARSGGWGIPFPGDPDQVVYVWIDALINYLTGLGFPDPVQYTTYWSDRARKLHVIGKNVWKFHAVYWPALLLSANLPLPDEIVVHGFLTSAGAKISKSSGSPTDPSEYIDRVGADGLRYFLLRYVRPFDDADFTVDRLDRVYDADLANGLGNLCARLTTLCQSVELSGLPQTDLPPAPAGYHEHLRTYQFDRALAELWRQLSAIDRELSRARPWEHIRTGDLTTTRAQLSHWVERLAAVGYWLTPFLPATARRIQEALCAPVIRKCEPLFPRLIAGSLQPNQQTATGSGKIV